MCTLIIYDRDGIRELARTECDSYDLYDCEKVIYKPVNYPDICRNEHHAKFYGVKNTDCHIIGNCTVIKVNDNNNEFNLVACKSDDLSELKYGTIKIIFAKREEL